MEAASKEMEGDCPLGYNNLEKVYDRKNGELVLLLESHTHKKCTTHVLLVSLGSGKHSRDLETLNTHRRVGIKAVEAPGRICWFSFLILNLSCLTHNRHLITLGSGFELHFGRGGPLAPSSMFASFTATTFFSINLSVQLFSFTTPIFCKDKGSHTFIFFVS